MKPSAALQSKTCLTLLSEAKTESDWEKELYMVAIHQKMKEPTNTYFKSELCIASCTAPGKAESLATAGT